MLFGFYHCFLFFLKFSHSLLGCLPCWSLQVFGIWLSQLGFAVWNVIMIIGLCAPPTPPPLPPSPPISLYAQRGRWNIWTAKNYQSLSGASNARTWRCEDEVLSITPRCLLLDGPLLYIDRGVWGYTRVKIDSDPTDSIPPSAGVRLNETGSRSPCMQPRSDPPNFGPITKRIGW